MSFSPKVRHLNVSDIKMVEFQTEVKFHSHTLFCNWFWRWPLIHKPRFLPKRWRFHWALYLSINGVADIITIVIILQKSKFDYYVNVKNSPFDDDDPFGVKSPSVSKSHVYSTDVRFYKFAQSFTIVNPRTSNCCKSINFILVSLPLEISACLYNALITPEFEAVKKKKIRKIRYS